VRPLALPPVAKWLEKAQLAAQQGDFKKALNVVRDGMWQWDAHAADLRKAQVLAADLAEKTDGRLEKRARGTAEALSNRAQQREREEHDLAHRNRLARIESNVTIFLLMKTDDEGDPDERVNAEAFALIAEHIKAWRSALHGCYMAGYAPVERFGRVAMSDAEQVRVQGLMKETANTIALDHAHVVENISSLRTGVPGCLGYAATTDDVRFRELLAALQRHSGTTLELPSELAMSTSLLDAMEAAAPPPDKRDLFKLVAGAAFYVGVGAGLQDVIEASGPAPPRTLCSRPASR
jgi:hypothetical protein